MLKRVKERRFTQIVKVHRTMISSPTDLTGDRPPSVMGLLLGKGYRKLFDDVDDDTLRRQIRWRRKMHPLIKMLLPRFMKQKQVIENREALKKGIVTNEPDCGIILPDEPVIWMGNHGFRDDAAATLNAAYRHTYMLFASLPQFYNTFDGIASNINGVVMINRKIKESKSSAVERAVQVMRNGADMMIFPEGVWNKSPNRLLLPLWPGIYRIAKETGAKIVPVVHYIRDPIAAHRVSGNDIHTVVDDPISIEGMSEKTALNCLRDLMATWSYLLMERYGKAEREAVICGHVNSASAWESYLKALVNTADYYDREIELKADYRSKEIARPEDAWEAVANIKNIVPENAAYVTYAQKIMQQAGREDFQRRF